MSTIVENAVQGFRLSPQQARLWSLQQKAPGVPLHAWCAVRIRGPLDPAALRAAVAAVAGQHEILRTSYQVLPELGVPVQVVDGSGEVGLDLHDLSGLDASGQAGAEAVWLEALPEQLRDPAGGSPLRVALFRRGGNDHVLYLALPALCADPLTLDNLAAGIGEAYGRAVEGGEEPAQAVQYIDYSEWLNEMLSAAEARDGRDFWEGRGFPPEIGAAVLDLWTPAADGAGPGAGTHRAVLPSGWVRDLDRVAGARGASPAAWLLAAWQVLVHRHTGRGDFTVRVGLEGRTYEEFQRSLGPFAKYVPVPGHVGEDEPFDALAARVEAALSEARAWQDFYAWSPHAAGSADGAGSHAALGFDHAVVVADAGTWGGAAWSVERRWHQLDHFGLRLSVERVRDGGEETLRATLHHDPATQAGQGAELLLRRFAILLRDTLDAPGARVDLLGLLDDEEREEVVRAWNSTAADAGAGVPVHLLFAEQAARTPDAAAVGFEGATLSYAELGARVDRLARALRGRGVGPDVRVGLLLERSPEMVVSILATLRAGGAYVPLDPGYPTERLRLMAEDARPALVLAGPGLESRLGGLAVPVEAPSALAAEPAGGDAPPVGVGDRSAAYVIYTSGSTGAPKGVVVEHAGLSNQMAWMQRRFPLAADDVVLQKTPFNFDASVWEIFAPLLAGAKLELAPQGSHADAGYLAEAVARNGVTTLQVVPSQLRLVLAAGGLSGWRTLRRLFSGGEALTGPLCAAVRAELPAVELVNLYGPTETTVQVASWEVGAAEEASVPIGRPISNTQLYVLDGAMQPVPAGVRGELYAGGAGVARGYLGRAELTAARFVPDPFGGRPGARLYRTGDLVRGRPDGALEFLGRVDDQVKVRGYRVEPGEVETVLERHPAVRAALVVVRSDDRGQARLVGYWTRREGAEEPSVGELSEYLLEHLPPYMVPATLVALDSFPLLPSGKVDRRALPEPEAGAGASRPYEAPATPVEEALALVWGEVLGMSRVGANDNFFALGGDSILSVRAVAMAKEQGLKVGVQDIFEHQTIRGLAQKIADATGESGAIESILRRERRPFDLIPAEDREKLPPDAVDAYPLAALQAGMLYHQELTPDAPAYHNINSYHLRGPWDEDCFRRAVQRAVDRHDNLRTSIHLRGLGEPLQVVHAGAEVPIAVEDIRHLDAAAQEAALRALREAEFFRLFDLTRPPLMRLFIHRRADDRFHLTMAENHAIADGWSTTSLFAEVFEDYAALLHGEPLRERAPLEVRFRDFVEMERTTTSSDASQAFWRGYLADFNRGTLPRLPQRFRPAEEAGTVGTGVAVSPELEDALRKLGRAAAVPLKSIVLAAHLKVLSMITGSTDVVTGLVNNGRPEVAGGTEVRGLFLNTLPLRLSVQGGTWLELIRGTFRSELQIMPHRRYPLAQLQREHGPQRLFETSFNLVHFHSVGELLRTGIVKLLGAADLADTSYPLTTTLGIDPATSQIYSLQLQFAVGLFSEAQAENLRGYYLRVLQAMAAGPDERHDAASLLSPGEWEEVVHGWNRTERPFTAEPVHRLFEAQAARTPEAVAVAGAGGRLTYAELNARADLLARHLRARGIGPERRVGLLLERSPELIVALLATFKAGGAYVPLDPATPIERLRLLVSDAGLSLLLAEPEDAERLGIAAPPVLLPADARGGEPPAAELPGGDADLRNAAYVIYTSGSTGLPKGVVVEHASLANQMLWMLERFPLAADDVVLQKTPFVFDASIWEIFAPLLAGARLELAPRGAHADGTYLAEAVARHGVTSLQLVPSQIRLALAAGGLAGWQGLRRLFSGGEALPADLRSAVAAELPRVELVNLYGPTEATIQATFAVAAPGEEGAVPIGAPIANARAYVLDGWMQPVPVGAPGEVYLGGAAPARGYLGRPEQTAERFLPDPFADTPGARLYRTGDLASWRPDGMLAYLGRADDQVKLRGYRLEMGEVEAVLRSHPLVDQAFAVVRADRVGEQRLVAYVVPTPGGAPSVGELLAYLRAHLPDYAVPSSFVVLDVLPLTPGGKVDRRALPQPDRSRPELEVRYLGPETELEERISAVWSEVLDLDPVGVHDNFFDLGGHSLLLMRLHERLEAALERSISLVHLLQYPTVRTLAEQLGGREESAAEHGESRGGVRQAAVGRRMEARRRRGG